MAPVDNLGGRNRILGYSCSGARSTMAEYNLTASHGVACVALLGTLRIRLLAAGAAAAGRDDRG